MTFFQAFFWRIVPKKGSNNALKCGLKYDFFGQKRQKSHNFSFKKYRRYWILRIRDSRLLDTVKTSEISFSRILMINILRLDYKCKKAREQVVHELGTLFPCIGSTFLDSKKVTSKQRQDKSGVHDVIMIIEQPTTGLDWYWLILCVLTIDAQGSTM